MRRSKKIQLVYVTSSKYKQQENKVFCDVCSFPDGTRVSDLFEFEFREKPVLQILEVDIETMVKEGVAKAYSQIGVPCIVEYAGLIFEHYKSASYPGGLTKAMWNALGSKFLTETNSAGKRAVARAVIGYCDGNNVYSFVGETAGTLSKRPRGERQFYWDTVFMPDDPSGKCKDKTYSQIVADPSFGLRYKMQFLSQSAKAMLKLLEHIRRNPNAGLWK